MKRDITISYDETNSTITAPAITDIQLEFNDATTSNDYTKYKVPAAKLTAFSTLVSSIDSFINSLTN